MKKKAKGWDEKDLDIVISHFPHPGVADIVRATVYDPITGCFFRGWSFLADMDLCCYDQARGEDIARGRALSAVKRDRTWRGTTDDYTPTLYTIGTQPIQRQEIVELLYCYRHCITPLPDNKSEMYVHPAEDEVEKFQSLRLARTERFNFLREQRMLENFHRNDDQERFNGLRKERIKENLRKNLDRLQWKAELASFCVGAPAAEIEGTLKDSSGVWKVVDEFYPPYKPAAAAPTITVEELGQEQVPRAREDHLIQRRCTLFLTHPTAGTLKVALPKNTTLKLRY